MTGLLQYWPWAFSALPGIALGVNVFNALTWPRRAQPPEHPPTFSILIPARNEERGIERLIRTIYSRTPRQMGVREARAGDVCKDQSAQPMPSEVIVYDDGSTDRTAEILAELQNEFDALRVETGIGLPEGWIGKPHACHRLSGLATKDVLVFLDADVEVLPNGLGYLLGLMDKFDADLVTAVPRQMTKTFFERLVLPVLHLTYTSWLPMPLVWKTHDPRFLAANGQVLAVRRETYDAIGGFQAVRHDVVDDMAFCANAKTHQRRVVFADGHEIARCRMYTSAQDVWDGFSKNLYEGIGATPMALLGVCMLYALTYIAPYILLLSAAWRPELLLPGAVAVGLNVAMRLMLAVRHRQPLEGVLLHPFSVVALLAIAINSWIWNRRGAIHWSGRTYPTKSSRKA